MVPPDKIGEVLSRYFASLQVPDVRPDATATKAPMRLLAHSPVPTVGPASQHYAQPVGGVMGAVLSAGPAGERVLRELRDHPVASIAEATGVPSMYRGVRDSDLGSVVRGAAQAAPFIGLAGKGLGALAGASRVASEAAPVAAAAGEANMSAEQLQEWRKIESFLRGRNSVTQNQRAGRQFDAMRTVQHASPYIRPGVEGMEIPMRPASVQGMVESLMNSGPIFSKEEALAARQRAGLLAGVP